MEIGNLERLNNFITEFKRKDFKTEHVSEVVTELESFYNIYNITTLNIGGLPIFRVRKVESNNLHLNKQSVWCPPSDYVKKVGRANDVGESMFYGAFDPLTAILEGRISVNDEFSIAIYYLIPMEAWNMTSIVISTPKEILGQSKELNDCSIALSKFMTAEFRKAVNEGNEYHYKKSCAIAKILFRIPKKDSIVYPSIQNENRVNIVMKEPNAKNRLELKTVAKCKLKKINFDNSVEIGVLEIAEAIKDKESLEYKATNEIEMKISYDTWVKNVMSFDDVFKPDNIASPEQIIMERFGNPGGL